MRPLFDLQDVADWLRTKPADERYDYANPQNCLGFHYLKHRGVNVSSYHVFSYSLKGERRYRYSSADFAYVIHPNNPDPVPQGATYGAALARAEFLLGKNESPTHLQMAREMEAVIEGDRI